MLHTKEFYDLMNAFERTSKHLYIQTGSQGFKREPKENWEKLWYYTDGEVNKAFRIFMAGYSLGKIADQSGIAT